MANSKWVVRVVLSPVEAERFGLMVTQFANCDAAVVHRNPDDGQSGSMCFDIPQESQVAADMNAERMASFGFNAVRAPAWYVGEVGR